MSRTPLTTVIASAMKQSLILFLTFCFFISNLSYPVYANDFTLPKPGVRVHLSPEFNPPVLKGLKVYPDNPFKFDFILDQGDSKLSSPNALVGDPGFTEQANRLIKYFLASLTVPEGDLWVNLSPHEKDRILPTAFGQTEMGRDLLAQDYLLKQITATLIYPEDEVGKKFWNKVYAESQAKYGTTQVPINTFNKVWIMPEKAVVYENPKAGTAYVVESKLKVMLEQDYLALEKNVIPAKAGIQNKNDVNELGSQIVKEIVIPELTKEVNEGKNFSQLRQVYQSLILAAWYKKKIKASILSQIYADKNKVSGLSYPNVLIGDPQHIYQQYLTAFKKGVFNYIKEETDPATQETIPRKYFSGGVNFAMTTDETNMNTSGTGIFSTIHDMPKGALEKRSSLAMIAVQVNPANEAREKIVITPQETKALFEGIPTSAQGILSEYLDKGNLTISKIIADTSTPNMIILKFFDGKNRPIMRKIKDSKTKEEVNMEDRVLISIDPEDSHQIMFIEGKNIPFDTVGKGIFFNRLLRLLKAKEFTQVQTILVYQSAANFFEMMVNGWRAKGLISAEGEENTGVFLATPSTPTTETTFQKLTPDISQSPQGRYRFLVPMPDVAFENMPDDLQPMVKIIQEDGRIEYVPINKFVAVNAPMVPVIDLRSPNQVDIGKGIHARVKILKNTQFVLKQIPKNVLERLIANMMMDGLESENNRFGSLIKEGLLQPYMVIEASTETSVDKDSVAVQVIQKSVDSKAILRSRISSVDAGKRAQLKQGLIALIKGLADKRFTFDLDENNAIENLRNNIAVVQEDEGHVKLVLLDHMALKLNLDAQIQEDDYIDMLSDLILGDAAMQVGANQAMTVATPSEQEEVFKGLDVHGREIKGREITEEFLRDLKMGPKYYTQVEGRKIFFSRPYKIKGRVALLAYVQDGDKYYVPRTYYLSSSQAVWRYLPSARLFLDEDDNFVQVGHFNKGYSEDSLPLGFQLQKIAGQILAREKVVELGYDDSVLLFVGTTRDSQWTYRKEVDPLPDKLTFKDRPHELNSYVKPEELTFKDTSDEPDFNQLLDQFEVQSPLYGKVQAKVFPSRDRKYKYSFYTDSKNRTWIGTIETNGGIGSVGLSRQWVYGGSFSVPAYEYLSQSYGYGNNKDIDGDYIDMWEKYLSKVPVIQDFQRRFVKGAELLEKLNADERRMIMAILILKKEGDVSKAVHVIKNLPDVDITLAELNEYRNMREDIERFRAVRQRLANALRDNEQLWNYLFGKTSTSVINTLRNKLPDQEKSKVIKPEQIPWTRLSKGEKVDLSWDGKKPLVLKVGESLVSVERRNGSFIVNKVSETMESLGPSVKFEGKQFIIGRSSTMSDFQVLGAEASRRHVQVVVNKDSLRIINLSELNAITYKFIQLGDEAMKATQDFDKGGIDFNTDKVNLEVKMDSRLRGNDNQGIQFKIDPAMLEQLRNAPGFVPVIINIQPMTNLPMFLGISQDSVPASTG